LTEREKLTLIVTTAAPVLPRRDNTPEATRARDRKGSSRNCEGDADEPFKINPKAMLSCGVCGIRTDVDHQSAGETERRAPGCFESSNLSCRIR